MKIVYLRHLAVFIALGSYLSGCSGPLTEKDILDLLSDTSSTTCDRGYRSASLLTAENDSPLPEKEVRLCDLLLRADQANPDIRAARAAVGVAAGLAWQAGLYPNPSVGIQSSEIGLKEDSGHSVVSITQPVVIGNRLRAAVAAADAEGTVTLADVELVRRKIYGHVIELHTRVLELAAQIKLVDELIVIAEQTLAIAEKRFNARAVSEPDVIRPRVEVYQLLADKQRLIHELDVAERKLGLVLNLERIDAARLTGDLSNTPGLLDKKALTIAVESGHPELIVADREIDAARATLKRIHAERVPDLDISAGIGYSDDDNQAILEFGIGIELPLWDQRQGDIMAARFELMKRRQNRVSRRNKLLAQLDDEIGRYNAARDQLQVIRDNIVPQSQLAFDQVDKAYRAGRVSFIDLLDAQRTLMQSKRTLVELAGSAALAKARVAAIAGLELLETADVRMHEKPRYHNP